MSLSPRVMDLTISYHPNLSIKSADETMMVGLLRPREGTGSD